MAVLTGKWRGLLIMAVVLVLIGAWATIGMADTSPPTVTTFSPAEGAAVKDSSVVISFTVSDPDLISSTGYYIKVNGQDVPAAIQYKGYTDYDSCTGQPYWVNTGYDQATISGTATGLAEGLQSVQVKAVDRAGNEVTKTWSFSISAPPVFADLAPANASTTKNNNSISVKVTDNTAVNGSSIVLTVDGLPVQAAFDSATGVVSYTANPPLLDGLHTVGIIAADTSGNSASATWSYTVMATGPQLTFAEAGKTLTNASPGLSVWAKSGVKLDTNSAISVDGQAIPTGFTYKGHWDYPMELDPVWVIESYNEGSIAGTPTGLKDGMHTLAASAQDYLGNITTTQWSFTVNSSPKFTEAFPADKANTTDNKGFTVKVADNDAILSTSVAVYMDWIQVPAAFDLNTGNISYLPVGGIPDGPHTVKASATDTTGNTTTYTWSFTAQVAGPNITFADNGKTFDIHNPPITVALKSNVKLDNTTAVITIDGSAVNTGFTYKGHWDYPMEMDPWWVVDSYNEATLGYLPQSLSDGAHEMAVTVKDILGNTSTSTFSFTIAQPPTFAELTPANGSIIAIKNPVISVIVADPNGPAVDKTKIVLTVDNNQVVPTLTDDNGAVKVSYTTTLAADTYHTITVSSTDTAVSPNTASTTWKFYINNKGDMPIDAKSCGSCHALNEYTKYVHTEGPLGIGVGHSSPTHFSGPACSHCHGGYNPKTCGYCHNGDISLWWDGDGWVRPEPVPDPTISAGQDCTYCHSGNNGGWIPSDYPAYHYYWVNNIVNTGVEPFKPLYPTLSYNVIHDILPLHKIEKGSCNNCHSTYLTREHNRKNKAGVQLDCATCHNSSDPKVQQAIATKNRDCLACHANADHEAVHQDNLDSNCQTCHAATLTTEHLNNKTTAGQNYSCDTCHASTNKEIVRTINAGSIDCAGCHRESTTHNVIFAEKVPADIPLYSGYTWSTPIEASIFAGEPTFPAGYEAGQAVMSNRRSEVTLADVWSFYNAQMSGQGWNLSSDAPAEGAMFFTAEFSKVGRYTTIKCFNTAYSDGAGQSTGGYRIEIWYR